MTSSASRPAAPGTPAALPPGKKGGALARRPAPALPPGKKGGPLARQAAQGGPKALPGTSGSPARLPAAGPIAGRLAGATGVLGAGLALGSQLASMSQPSRGQQAINRRVSDDAARKAEERANPTRGGLTGDQRLANARADQKRREVRQAAEAQKKSAPPSSSSRQIPASGGGGGARVPSSGGGGSPSRPATVPPKPAPGQSPNMDENYATWTRANKKLAEKVKPGQAGYAVIQKTLAQMKGGA